MIMNGRVDKHRDKLIRDISEEVTVMFEKILDYAEVAVPNHEQYKKLRSKILRISNNCLRNIKKEVSTRYAVRYDPPAETIIEVKAKEAKE